MSALLREILLSMINNFYNLFIYLFSNNVDLKDFSLMSFFFFMEVRWSKTIMSIIYVTKSLTVHFLCPSVWIEQMILIWIWIELNVLIMTMVNPMLEPLTRGFLIFILGFEVLAWVRIRFTRSDLALGFGNEI